MTKSWRKHYAALVAFVEDQPAVVIKENLVSIDETVKESFYQKFNAVRSAFLMDHFPDWLHRAGVLASAYGKAEGLLRQSLSIESVSMSVPLQRFLSDPPGQIVRDLFDPLFALLQGKLLPDSFEALAKDGIHRSFPDLYQRGFIKWFILRIIQALEADRLFEVPLPRPTSKQIIKHRDDVRQNIPAPRETAAMRFEVDRRDILLAPDFILGSKSLEKFVAFRTEFGKALWRAAYYNENREWLSIDALIEKFGFTKLKPDLLLYLGDKVEELSMVADCEKICRPDLSFFFMDRLDDGPQRSVERVDEIIRTHRILQPSRGSWIVAGKNLPEGAMAKLDGDIRVLHSGLKDLNLEPLMAGLAAGPYLN